MAARRKIEIFIDITDEKESENIIKENSDQLICAEVYSNCFGSCTALDRLFTTIKLDWSDGKMILLKIPADEIDVLQRFRYQSEPVYLFILKEKVTTVLRGVDAIKMAEVAKVELQYYKMEQDGIEIDRPTYDLDQPTPYEMEWMTERAAEKKSETIALENRRAARQAARKRHRAELMIPHLRHLNFVLFWPHSIHAHPELYERWDLNNIVMVGREEMQLTKEIAEDIFYAGDAPINEASMHKLLSGRSLAICFRLLDTDKHFVSLVRSILYDQVPTIDEDKLLSEQPPRKTAFDLYKSFSPTREQVLQERQKEKIRRKEEEIEKRARRLSEMQRLARQAIEEAIQAKRVEKEKKKMELLKSGNLAALDQMTDEDEEVDIVIPENLPEEDVEGESSEEDDDNEYLPPAGLLIPGFYAPPSDIAKVNGLAILFPKLVKECVSPQDEFLPPHVLVALSIQQRYTAMDVMRKHKSSIIHMGIFRMLTPYDAVHIAYSVRQYEQLNMTNEEGIRLAYMLSVKIDLPLLELMDLKPEHVSRDSTYGEDECAAMFPVDYADTYPEFEDFGDMTVLKSTEY
ncbi:unnamed protein product [Diatraea saccharalis]|uniref:DUF4746 domain-containing protein n=1 Tax=Diatraea saccharalis TaxID=40085 RepID=A0A9N9WJR7_9NEOP|nr:unnamed protein product [Diatraea saccharalis]